MGSPPPEVVCNVTARPEPPRTRWADRRRCVAGERPVRPPPPPSPGPHWRRPAAVARGPSRRRVASGRPSASPASGTAATPGRQGVGPTRLDHDGARQHRRGRGGSPGRPELDAVVTRGQTLVRRDVPVGGPFGEDGRASAAEGPRDDLHGFEAGTRWAARTHASPGTAARADDADQPESASAPTRTASRRDNRVDRCRRWAVEGTSKLLWQGPGRWGPGRSRPVVRGTTCVPRGHCAPRREDRTDGRENRGHPSTGSERATCSARSPPHPVQSW